jgi:hypothetical protein
MQILDYSIIDYFILDSLPGENFKTVIHIKTFEQKISIHQIDISNMDVCPKIKRCIDFILGI